MDRKAAGEGPGARAAPAPAPPSDAPAKPAAASRGRRGGGGGRRGRRPPPPPPPGDQGRAALGDGGGGDAPEEEEERGELAAAAAGTGDQPARDGDGDGDEGAWQKQQERAPPAKAAAAAASVARARSRPGSREQKAPPEPGAGGPGRGPGPPGGAWLQRVLERLTLRRVEVSEAARQVNAVRDRLAEAIQRRLYLRFAQPLGTGSYYERLKINQPDEFDIMLKVPGVRVELEPYDGGDCKGVYYFVKLKRNAGLQRLNDFVDDQQRLSASKVLSELRSIIIKEVKNINGMKVTVERKKPGSPAVTLQIGEPPSHISVDIILALEMPENLGSIRKGGPDIKKWLGVKQQNELDKMKLCLVPKNAKDGAHFTDTWRLSFSLAEKNIIQYHGNTKTCCEVGGSKCCRKDCLKLLKYLLEQLKTKHQSRKQFSKFCSYHAKTAFFHTCTKWTRDEEWLPINLEECFGRLLDYFNDCLRKTELKHFFIPDCNLFCTDSKCKILKNVIESERTAKFPLFQQT